MAQSGFGLRTFETKPFMRFARREGIPDAAKCDAAQRAGRGQVDADLGGGVIKQRNCSPWTGQVRRLPSDRAVPPRRTVVLRLRVCEERRHNLRRDELETFRLTAEQMLGMDDAGLQAALSNGTITEVVCDG